MLILLIFALLLVLAVFLGMDSFGKNLGTQRNVRQRLVPQGISLNVSGVDAPFIDQRKDFPTGCEAVSTVMALQYLGMDITVDEFIDNYLELGKVPTPEGGVLYGCSPWEAFPGNPRSKYGWGCYAPAIEKALDKFIDPAAYTVSVLNEVPLEELCEEYIDKKIPVILWATMNMDPPMETPGWIIEDTGEEIVWIAPAHCLLLVDYDESHYYFNDPLAGKRHGYSKEVTEAAYAGMYSQAIAITKTE